MFDGNDLSEAMGVPLYYGAVEAIVLSLYCIGAWKAGWTKAPPTDSLWKVIATSYEVLLIEQDLLQEIEVSLAPKDSTESTEGSTIFHYFHMVDSPRLSKKAPSGLDVNALMSSENSGSRRSSLSSSTKSNSRKSIPSAPGNYESPIV